MSKIFMSSGKDRFFRIPDDATLVVGDLELRSAAGIKLKLDPHLAEKFEIPKDEAETELRAAELGDIEKELAALGKQLRATPGKTVPTKTQKLLDALGVKLEDLRGDPKRLGKRIGERLATMELDKVLGLRKAT